MPITDVKDASGLFHGRLCEKTSRWCSYDGSSERFLRTRSIRPSRRVNFSSRNRLWTRSSTLERLLTRILVSRIMDLDLLGDRAGVGISFSRGPVVVISVAWHHGMRKRGGDEAGSA